VWWVYLCRRTYEPLDRQVRAPDQHRFRARIAPRQAQHAARLLTFWACSLLGACGGLGEPSSIMPAFDFVCDPLSGQTLGCGTGSSRVFSIRSANADGSDVRALTYSSATILAEPAISPDGQFIAFDCRGTQADVCAMRSDGTGFTKLTDDAAKDFLPAFSPDGNAIVFSSDRDGDFELYCLASSLVPDACGPTDQMIDGRPLRRLTDEPASDTDPAFSPDGSRIAFATNRDGNFEIYTMTLDGTELRRLTNNPADDFSPVWSPNGTAIAFVSTRDGNREIYVMRSDGTDETNVSRNRASDANPSFSPEGGLLAFDSDRDRDRVSGGTRCEPGSWCPQVYVMNVDGTAPRPVTSEVDGTGAHRVNADPVWMPDGLRIIFETTRF
jgi:Tol biopolymer transport system component